MPAGPRLVARRTTLALGAAGVAGLVAVTGCDGGSSEPRPGATTTVAADPDETLVNQVLAALGRAWNLTSDGLDHPELARPMTGLVRMHRAHIRALGGEPERSGSGPLPADAADAMRTVRRQEQRLQHRLVEAAMAAESGALARLLASMSAAVSQQLSVLPGAVS